VAPGIEKCRFPECFGRQHRFGLCNKHRKWVERGYMTEDLKILKKVERPSYKGKLCRYEGCGRQPRRNWLCEKHSDLEKRRAQGIEPKPRYARDFGCVVCGRKGKISKGLCPKHHQQYRRGAIDLAGQPLRVQRRTYTSEDFCPVKNCRRKPRVRGWCQLHAEAKKKGIYDEKGKRLIPAIIKNRGKTCTSCDKPAYAKGLCRIHYWRLKTGYLGPAGFKNKGQPCSTCGKPAVCRTLCDQHYRRLLAKEVRRSSVSRDHNSSVGTRPPF